MATMVDRKEFKRKHIRYTLRLALQLDKAIAYLAETSPKQAKIMGRQFFQAVSLLEAMPGIGIRYKNGMRKIRLGKFRYNIFYRENENEIELLGIWHTSRGTEFDEDSF